MSVIKGGAALDSLLKGCQTEWGKRLYGKTLIRNIAGSLYKQKGDLEDEVRNSSDHNKPISSLMFSALSATLSNFRLSAKLSKWAAFESPNAQLAMLCVRC